MPREIDPDLVRCFAAVLQAGSFTKAGEQLGLTQPQVSTRIAKLEHQVGAPLFARSTRHVELTETGRRFKPYAEDVSRACHAAQMFIAALQDAPRRRFVFGTPEISVPDNCRNAIVRIFMDRFPDVDLSTCVDSLDRLTDMQDRQELDAVLMYRMITGGRGASPAAGYEQVYVSRKIGHICIPADNPLAHAPQIRLEDLAGEKVAISPGRDCPQVLADLGIYLNRHGIGVVAAPETHRPTLQHFAYARRLLFFQWLEPHETQPKPEGMVARRLEGDPLVLEQSLRVRKDAAGLARSILDVARDVAVRHSLRQASTTAELREAS
jgi:DNA-binding transcriptional LysR family regulator